MLPSQQKTTEQFTTDAIQVSSCIATLRNGWKMQKHAALLMSLFHLIEWETLTVRKVSARKSTFIVCISLQ